MFVLELNTFRHSKEPFSGIFIFFKKVKPLVLIVLVTLD